MSNPTVVDLTGIVGPGYASRNLRVLDDQAVHHTASGGDWASLALDRTDEERIAHALAIDAYHIWKGYGGIGYSALVFASGLITWHGPLTQQRAGVAHENPHVVSWAVVGDFTTGPPTPEALASGAWLVRKIRADLGLPTMPIRPHRYWNQGNEWATACPGDYWEHWLPALVAAADEAEEDDMATEWEDYTRGLESELNHFQKVKLDAAYIENLGQSLAAFWRRSSSDPPLDHELVWRFLPSACDDLIAAAEALKKRATDRGF